MRFRCKIFLPKNSCIPNDYRRHLLSLIKEAIKNSAADGEEFYNRLYNDNTTKPFTFSAYLPIKKENGDNKLDGDFFSFFFSTNDYEFLMRVYNGFMAIKKNSFMLFGKPIEEIKDFFLLPEKSFTKNEAIFKTLSPFLVRSLEDGDKYLYPANLKIQTKDKDKKGEHWKYWKEVKIEDFNMSLLQSLNSLLETEQPASGTKIESLELSGSSVIVPILHGSGNREHEFLMTFPGIKGEIKIKAAPEVLKLLYDIGIG
ncbi:MAG: hypothetical protein N2Z76_09465, partial [Treponemataceae bacterium]|nr:hypothetical protein [Treponemataceae bacterium]